MQRISSIISAVVVLCGFLAPGVFAMPGDLLVTANGTKNYTIVPVMWAIDLPGVENGTFQLNGTVEDVQAYINVVYPDYTPTPTPTSAPTKVERAASFTSGTLISCIFRPVPSFRVMEGVYYLRRVPGKPTNGPGPGNCGRVSCSWNTGIYWCNDNKEAKTLDSFGDIADGAESIARWCSYVSGAVSLCRGQNFYEDGWNVIVREEVRDDRC